jgi:hypothetical protein
MVPGVRGETNPAKQRKYVVPVERIELPTFGLQNRCSTAELNRLVEDDGWTDRQRPQHPLSGYGPRGSIAELSAKGYFVVGHGALQACPSSRPYSR